MKKHPLAAAGALGLALALVVAAPAAAADFSDGDVVVGGTTWSVYDVSAGNRPALNAATTDAWGGIVDTFDDGLSPFVIPDLAGDPGTNNEIYCDSDGDLQTATDGTGDEVVACSLDTFDTGSSAGSALGGSWELRFFADGVTVRARLSITNDSDVTVTGAAVALRDNYYQDSETALGASTTAGQPADAADTVVDGDRLWIVYSTLEDDDYPTPAVMTAAGTADAAITPVFPSGVVGPSQDVQLTTYALPDLAPGQTVQIVQFYVWNFFDFDEPVPLDVSEPATSDAAVDAASLSPALEFVPASLVAVEELWDTRNRFDSLGTRDAAGIDNLDEVLNWMPAAEPELAATGPDSAGSIAAAAVALLVGGAFLVVARRRRALTQ